MKSNLLLSLMVAVLLVNNSIAQSWQAPGTNVGFTVNCHAVYKGELYVGFHYYAGAKLFCVAKLQDGQWVNVGGGVLGINSEVSGMAVYKDELYVGGWFTDVEGKRVSSIARWNGAEWNDVAKGVDGYVKYVSCLAVYKDELYVGGAFKSTGGQTSYHIARWNGATWSPVGSGVNAGVTSMIVYKDELYIGGEFLYTSAKTVKLATKLNHIGKWDGENWSTVGPTNGLNSPRVGSFSVFNDELYVYGYSGEINGTTDHSQFAKWNGSEWSTVGKLEGEVNSTAVFRGELYAAGLVSRMDGKKVWHIVKWDGKQWTELNEGGANDRINYIFEYNDELWVTGIFTEAGGKKIKYMAKYR